jgi:hypothetical protein
VLITTAIWLINPALIIALDDRFGETTDAYVNGSQVWLRDDGPNNITLEWRLHPVASYVKPKGVPTNDVFGRLALALAQGEAPYIEPTTLWDGLEAFAAYDEEIDEANLRVHVVRALGIEPFAVGQVDHEQIGDAWERDEGRRSVVDDLRRQLGM